MQLKLDEEREIGSIPMFSATGNDHEMYVALIRYKDRRYISLSRMDRHKLKKTGEEKLIHRNSIWIPISDGKKIGELIWRAASEAVRLGWEDIYDEEKANQYATALEEGEKIFRYSVNVCRDAKLFLSTAKDLLEVELGLTVSIPDVAKTLSLTLPQIIRAIDYLEDAGYIKRVKFFSAEVESYSYPFYDLMPSVMEILSYGAFKEKIRQRAMQLSKFSEDQVEELDYLDDDDPRNKCWECFYRLAEAEILTAAVSEKIPASFEISANGYDWLDND